MERLLQTFKDPNKLSLLSAALFFVGVISSSYLLFALPHDLIFKGGMSSQGLETLVHAKVFVIVLLTFGMGIIAINASLRAKKEVIVFKEKKNETEQAAAILKDASEASIDVKEFVKKIKAAKPGQQLQEGINTICQLLTAGQGAFYVVKDESGKRVAQLKSAFAIPLGESETIEFEFGDGLIGQSAASGKSMYLDEMPEGYNNTIISGLGMAAPKYIFITPVKKENTVIALLEIATFSPLTDAMQKEAGEMARILAEQV